MDVFSEINSVSTNTYNFNNKFYKFSDFKKGEILKVSSVELSEFVDEGVSTPVFKANLVGTREGSVFLPGRVRDTLFKIHNNGKIKELSDSYMIFHEKSGIQNKFAFAKTFYEAKLLRIEKFRLTEQYPEEDMFDTDNISEPGEMVHSPSLPPKKRKQCAPKKNHQSTQKKNQLMSSSDESSDDCIMLEQNGQVINTDELDKFLGEMNKQNGPTKTSASKKKKFSKEHLKEFLEEN